MADGQYEDVEFEANAPRARTASIATMGQLLLQGYAMLADSCETCGVPLMRKSNSQEIICVNCNTSSGGSQPAPSTPARALPNGLANGNSTAHLEENEDEEEKELEEDLGIEAAPRPLRERITQPILPTTASEGIGERRSIDSSQAIADKMLEGWALLGEHCPLCSTPFVRSRDRRIYCVACDLYAVREGAENPTGSGSSGGGAGQQRQNNDQVAGAVPITSNTTTDTGGNSDSGNIRVIASKPSLEANSVVKEHVTAAQISIAGRLSRTAAILERASMAEATALLEEIKACVEALNGMKMLLS